jgi:sugar transferase (PEP-CTERM system associated)
LNRQHKFLLLFCDLLFFLGSLIAVAFLRSEILPLTVLTAAGTMFMTFVVLILLYIFGAYDINHSTTPARLLGRACVAIGLTLAFVISVHYFGGRERAGIFGRGILIGTMVIFGVLSTFMRSLIATTMARSFRKARWLFVMTRNLYNLLVKDLGKNVFQGQAFFILNEKLSGDPENVIGTWDKNLNGALAEKWTSIVTGLDDKAPDHLIENLMMARFDANRVRDLVQFYEETWQKVPLYYLGSRWFLLTEGFHLLGNPVRLRLKRLMDVGISSILLLFSSPIMLLAAILIRLDSPGPALYTQTRTGRDGKDFTIFKFRSMRIDAEKDGAQWASKNDSRVTRIGNFLRKTRIDELPQLFNILKGSMSFVGPRPERPEFNHSLEKELSFYNLRHMVQPGLTGWAQVSYPYGASLEDAKEKLQYDLFYIKSYSLWLDISIVLKTVTVVVFGRGQ